MDVVAQRRIVSALGAGVHDTVVELGPGKGALTRHLIGAVRHLRLVEIDRTLADHWRNELAGREDASVVEGDMLRVPLHEAFPDPGGVLVVGNIPYNITSPLIFRLLAPPRPRQAVITVQREVASRLTAAPGTSEYGALTVGVRSVAETEYLFGVAAGAFRPRPKVGSAAVRITPVKPPPLGEREERSLRRVVRACFGWRRKQIGRTLRSHPDLDLGRELAVAVMRSVNIHPEQRPETLSPEDFLALARAVSDVSDRAASNVPGRHGGG